MPKPKRRKSGRRSSRPRLPIAVILIALSLVGLIVYGCTVVKHQINSYFGGAANKKHEAVSGQSPASEVSPGPENSPAGVPSPLESGLASPGPKVAIIIDDCGYSEERCKLFLKLPIPITLSILPMTAHGKQIEADALAAGKSVMLHLPMEPDSPQFNPGAGAITTEMTNEQVQAQVEADVNSLPDVPGANNHMGSKATSDPRVMRDVLDVLQKRHMFFIDSVTSGSTLGGSTARELGIPTADRDIFLDNQKDLPYIRGQIKQLEDVALKRGSAIAIGHPNESTAQALAEAIPQMQSLGITFVTAESLVK
jgi:polysaccharide deacetylase 2 family uncharacterized protein YibQ